MELLAGSLLQGNLTITVCKDFWQCDPLLPPIQGPFVPSLHLLLQTYWAEDGDQTEYISTYLTIKSLY